MSAKEVNDNAFRLSAMQLQDTVTFGGHLGPMLVIHTADAQPVAVFVFTATDPSEEVDWRDVLGFIATMGMAGFARAAYATLVSDTWYRTAKREEGVPQHQRGDLQRMHEAGDDSVKEALMCMTYGRDDVSRRLAPYFVTKKHRVRWDEEEHRDDNATHFSGYLHDVLEHAVRVQRVEEKICEEMGVASIQEAYRMVTGSDEEPMSVVRAHNDAAVLRLLLEPEELRERYVMCYFPEDAEANEVMSNAVARLAEWHPYLCTARSNEEMVEKMRRKQG